MQTCCGSADCTPHVRKKKHHPPPFRAKRGISLPLRFKRRASGPSVPPALTDNKLGGRDPRLRVIIALIMSTQQSMLTEFPWDQRYQLSSIADVLTPALLLYPEILAANIHRTVELLDGDPNRWRVHIKTAKLGYTVRTLVACGIPNFKCPTPLH